MGNNSDMGPDLLTVISGSFRKHLNEIVRLKQALELRSIGVLSPAGNLAVNPDEEFIVLDSDPIEDPKLLQDSVFAKIRRSTFLVVANIDGYLGRAAIMEIGYAIAIGISIFTLEPVEDPNLAPYCRLLSQVFPGIETSIFEDIEDLAYENRSKIAPINPRQQLAKLKSKAQHAHSRN
jgi:hypothetical protein